MLSEYTADIQADFTERLADEESAFRIHQFLHDMDEPYKEVFSLRVFGELPFDRIGELFGKSSGWARVTYYRAKRKYLNVWRRWKMKKISCDIIRDILPLYLDDVVSDDTKELVEEHLETCDRCKREADILKKKVTLLTNKTIKLSDAKVLKGLRNRLFRKKVIVSLLSIAVSVAIMVGAYAYMTFTKLFIPYDSTDIQIEEADGKLYASYSITQMAGSVNIDNSSVIIDGEEKNVIIFSHYETLWSKYMEPIFDKSHGERNQWCLGNRSEIDQVYYAEFDLGTYWIPTDILHRLKRGILNICSNILRRYGENDVHDQLICGMIRKIQ